MYAPFSTTKVWILTHFGSQNGRQAHPEKCPKPTIAEVLARSSQEKCPLYDEHIFDEPYDDFIRAEVDKRHEERVKARQQEIKEEEKRLEELLTEKIEELRKIAKEKRPGKGREGEPEERGLI